MLHNEKEAACPLFYPLVYIVGLMNQTPTQKMRLPHYVRNDVL